MPRLYLKFNSAVIKEIDLTKPETTFGRKPANDVVIDHATVSGFHGKIVKEGDRYFVEDLNSTNGTFVNGNRIKRAEIKNKDQIGVARHILEFLTEIPPPTGTVTPSAKALSLEQFVASGSAPEAKSDLVKPSSPAPVPAAPASAPSVAPSVAPSAAAPSPAAASATGDSAGAGVIKIVSGGVEGQTEVHLKELVTYIGTAESAAIKIKGFLAPSLAAAISRRPEGYFLKAVKAGYPKVNGTPVKEQIFLESGALIEVAGTNMVFYHSEAKKGAAPPP